MVTGAGRGLGRVLLWVAGGMALAVMAAVCAVIWSFVAQERGPSDLGPLVAPAVSPPTSAPTSSVRAAGLSMECHSHPGSPVVIVVRRSGGSIVGAWDITSIRVNGEAIDKINSCRLTLLKRVQNGFVAHGAVTGPAFARVEGEHVTFYLDGTGRLTEYYISWD